MSKIAADLVGDDYRIGDEIGRGATSIVYAARDVVRRRDVAVKVITLDSPLNRARLLREVTALRAVEGTAGPRMFATVISDGRAALVMERIRGTRLADLIRHRPMRWRSALALGSSIGRAAEKLHQRRVIHRDLTPLNVLVSADGTRLIDFGSAWSPGWGAVAEPALEARGTPRYAAPEQTAGETVTAAADVFSLGTILVECVGRDRDTPPTVLRELARLRAPDPSSRPRSGRAAAEVLDAVAASGSTDA